MNGKKAKLPRKVAKQDFSDERLETKYEGRNVKNRQGFKSPQIRLDPLCIRAAYKHLKKLYKQGHYPAIAELRNL